MIAPLGLLLTANQNRLVLVYCSAYGRWLRFHHWLVTPPRRTLHR
jgi:hypothetical protein